MNPVLSPAAGRWCWELPRGPWGGGHNLGVRKHVFLAPFPGWCAIVCLPVTARDPSPKTPWRSLKPAPPRSVCGRSFTPLSSPWPCKLLPSFTPWNACGSGDCAWAGGPERAGNVNGKLIYGTAHPPAGLRAGPVLIGHVGDGPASSLTLGWDLKGWGMYPRVSGVTPSRQWLPGRLGLSLAPSGRGAPVTAVQV